MATAANMSSLQGASDGFFSTVKQAFGEVLQSGLNYSSKYLSDQWGLAQQGNGVDQTIFQGQAYNTGTVASQVPTANLQKAGLIDLNVQPNTVLVLIIAGAILFIALT